MIKTNTLFKFKLCQINYKLINSYKGILGTLRKSKTFTSRIPSKQTL